MFASPTSSVVGVNNVGFGGANSHVLLRGNSKVKKLRSRFDLPRLVCVSARTREGVLSLLDSVIHSKLDPEYIALLDEGFRYNSNN